MDRMESTIEALEDLHRSLTGRDPSPAAADEPVARIPPAEDPIAYVESQLLRLKQRLGEVMMPPRRPPMVLAEDDATFRAWVDLPGVDRDSLEVLGNGPMLEIRARRTIPAPARRVRVHESMTGELRRVLVFPEPIAPERVHARLTDGVLEIRVLRAAPIAARPMPMQ